MDISVKCPLTSFLLHSGCSEEEEEVEEEVVGKILRPNGVIRAVK